MDDKSWEAFAEILWDFRHPYDGLRDTGETREEILTQVRELQDHIQRCRAWQVVWRHGGSILEGRLDKDVRLSADGREVTAFEFQWLACKRPLEELEVQVPKDIGHLTDIASLPLLLPLGEGRYLPYELPGVVVWDLKQPLAAAPLAEGKIEWHLPPRLWEVEDRLRKQGRITDDELSQREHSIAAACSFALMETRLRQAYPRRGVWVEGRGAFSSDMPTKSFWTTFERELESEAGFGRGIESRESQRRPVSLHEPVANDEEGPALVDTLSDEASTEPVDAVDDKDMLQRLLDELPEMQRLAVLKEWEAKHLGLFYKEICQRDGLDYESTRRNLSFAHRALRTRMRELGL